MERDGERTDYKGRSSMDMEATSSKNLLFSCWGRLKLKLPWLKRGGAADRRRQRHKSLTANLDCKSIATTLSVAQPKPIGGGGFRYDPLSYSQNFDDGCWHADGDAPSRGFSSRYATPPPPTPPLQRAGCPHELR